MSTYTGSAFATKYAAYLIYKGSATAAALNISQPKIGYVYDITEGGTLTPGNITVQQGDAVVYLAQGWTHCNNGGADQAIANLSSQFDELLEEIGETDFSKFALKTELPTVPTNVSAFTNDAGYLTQHQSLANYALKTEIPDISNLAPYSAIPQNVSQLTNDAHYLTEAVLNNRVRKVDDLAQDTDATDGEIVQLTTDGRFYRFTEPQAEGESGTWTTINQPADIASDDQILSQNNSGKLTATLGMSYNATNQHLELKGNNDAVVAYVDMAVFIKDGMLDDVQLYTTAEQGVTVEAPYLKFTFNVASGKSVIRVSLKDLVDIYDGANINLTSAFVKAAQYSAPAIGDSMNVAIGKLLKGHEDNAAAIATKQDILTFDSTPTANSTKPVTSQGIKAAIDAAVGNVPNALKQKDLTTYTGTDGEIVQHTGATTEDYVNGWNYKFTAGQSTSTAACGTLPNTYDASVIPNDYTTKINSLIYAAKPVMMDSIGVSVALYTSNDVYKDVLKDGQYSVGDRYGNDFRAGNIISSNETDTKITISVPNMWGSTAEVEFLKSTLQTFPLFRERKTNLLFALVPKGGDEYKIVGFDEDYRQQYTWQSANDVTFTESSAQGGWQQWNSQPSSAADVSDLKTRMTAAETAIGGKQASITGAASSITNANLTASKVLGSDANGKVAATSIATTDAEDAVSKRHTQNTDTKIVGGNNKVEVTSSGVSIVGYTVISAGGEKFRVSSNGVASLANTSVTGNLSVSGNLNVTGKETVEEIVNIKSENNFITLRDGAQTAIASGSLSGTKVENYDGLGNDLLFGTDASGVFRIGDEGGTLEPIATRDEAANLTDGQLMKWDAANQRLVGLSDIAPQINSYVASKAMTEDAYWDLVTAGTVQADTLYITYDNDWEG